MVMLFLIKLGFALIICQVGLQETLESPQSTPVNLLKGLFGGGYRV